MHSGISSIVSQEMIFEHVLQCVTMALLKSQESRRRPKKRPTRPEEKPPNRFTWSATRLQKPASSSTSFLAVAAAAAVAAEGAEAALVVDGAGADIDRDARIDRGPFLAVASRGEVSTPS